MTDPGTAGGAAPAPPAGGGVPGEIAEYGPRFIAFLIDCGILIVIGIVFSVLVMILGKVAGILASLISLVHLAVVLGYYIYLVGMDNPLTGRGQTYGKKVMNIKAIKVDGSDLGPVDAILRLVGYFISEIVILLGFVWIFIDDNNQGWHDKIAKTYVIKC
jgi:uncharacterized RDD family membrane protein YckC